jgi:hypothetical protein
MQQLVHDVLHTSTRGCNGARRGAQAWASVTVLVKLVAVMHPSSPRMAGRVQAVCGPVRAPASPPPRTPRTSNALPPIASASSCARAAVRLGRLCGAAHNGTGRCPGRPRRRRASAARRWRRFGHISRHSAAAWTCTADGGNLAAPPTDAEAATANPRRFWAFTSASDAINNRTIRRLPSHAA